MDFIGLAQQCAPTVHPTTLAAIVKTESAFKPFAIGINNRTATLKRQPETKAEAVATATRLIADGHNIDMGLGQINSSNLSRLAITVEDVFDPCKNLAAAATVLTDNFTRATARTSEPQEALKKALSAYNTGNFVKGLQNGYVFNVAQASKQLNQGYTVPAIKIAPGEVVASDANKSTVLLSPSSAPAARPSNAAKTQTKQSATDPAMVFGNSPAGGDDEANSALVF